MTLAHIVGQPPALLDALARRAEQQRVLPQAQCQLQHIIHAGVYTRHLRIPAGVELHGVLIKTPTMLIVTGDLSIGTGGDSLRLIGVHTVIASANRRMALITHKDSTLSMSFATKARTLEEAEAEFTDEVQLLARSPQDTFTYTGE